MFTHRAPRSSKNLFRNVREFQDRTGIWKCWFLRRGENQSTWRKTSWSRVENQQQTQPTYDTGSRNRTRDTLVGGKHSHHCANPLHKPYFVDFPCKPPLPICKHFVLHQGWSLMRELNVTRKPRNKIRKSTLIKIINIQTQSGS